jgi:hypothetical protein
MNPKRTHPVTTGKFGARALRGMAVTMSDGWSGKVQEAGGGIIACVGNGERRPNDHWVGDYRLVGPSSIRIVGGKAMASWKAVAASKPFGDQKSKSQAAIPKLPGRGVVVDLARARLEREWQSRAIS